MSDGEYGLAGVLLGILLSSILTLIRDWRTAARDLEREKLRMNYERTETRHPDRKAVLLAYMGEMRRLTENMSGFLEENQGNKGDLHYIETPHSRLEHLYGEVELFASPETTAVLWDYRNALTEWEWRGGTWDDVNNARALAVGAIRRDLGIDAPTDV